LFKDAGLGAVTVQRASISHEQISTLFWLNIVIGLFLCGMAIAIAPVVVSFYREPRLYWVTVALSTAFIFNAAAIQHQALLQRQLRSVTMAVIDITSLLASIAVGIAMALAGFSYWSLVGSAIVLPAVSLVGVWFATRWVPGIPHRNVGTRSMFRFGGTITLNSLVVYIAYNLDKILLGRFWGAEALGYYGRAYQLVNLPTEQLNSAVGWIAFPALSRIQDDPRRLKNYFLKGYSLVLGMTIPVTIACGLFAEDMILVLLGPRWKDTIGIFRLFSPTILAFAFINPFSWLLFSTGKVARSLKIALVLAPSLIAAYLLGIPYGPTGIASGFSIMMVLMIVPVIAWAKQGSGLSSRDIYRAVNPPFLSGIISGSIAFTAQHFLFQGIQLYQRFILEIGVLFASYVFILFYVVKQKEFYMDLIKELKNRS
jgi:PST family polysaccharide transporter